MSLKYLTDQVPYSPIVYNQRTVKWSCYGPVPNNLQNKGGKQRSGRLLLERKAQRTISQKKCIL